MLLQSVCCSVLSHCFSVNHTLHRIEMAAECIMNFLGHLLAELFGVVSGYPVMIKASAGGGGKGLRIAWNDEECRYGNNW